MHLNGMLLSCLYDFRGSTKRSLTFKYLRNTLKLQSCKLKKLMNDHLRVSKVYWKFRIPTVCNFALIFSWKLLFSEKSGLLFNSFYYLFNHILSVSIIIFQILSFQSYIICFNHIFVIIFGAWLQQQWELRISRKIKKKIKISSQGIIRKKINYICYIQSKFHCPKINTILLSD